MGKTTRGKTAKGQASRAKAKVRLTPTGRVSRARPAGTRTPEAEAVGQIIRRARLAHNWSQEKLAQELGVCGITVSRWERGLSLPHDEHRRALADTLALGSGNGRRFRRNYRPDDFAA